MIKYRIVNLVASGRLDVSGGINIDKLSVLLGKVEGFHTEYEPEQFPGLVVKLRYPRVSFLLFRTGKVVCTGANTVVRLKEALGLLEEAIMPLIERIGMPDGGKGKKLPNIKFKGTRI